VEVVDVEGVGTEITQHQGLSDMQMLKGNQIQTKTDYQQTS